MVTRCFTWMNSLSSLRTKNFSNIRKNFTFFAFFFKQKTAYEI